MILREGPGFLIRSAPDGPWAGWIGSRFLEEGLASVNAAPGRALARLMRLCALLPGGLALVWDHPPAWMQALPPEAQQGWWEALSDLPGLSLHLAPATAAQLPGGAFRAWVHGPEPPEGPLGERWRQGTIAWVRHTGGAWRLPNLGCPPPAEEVAPGWLWGEAILPVGALGALASGDLLATALVEAQGAAERGMAQRLAAEAWTGPPFVRRSIGWRLALTGGAEFHRAGGTWKTAFGQLRALAALLQERLRAPIHLGASSSFEAASLLGRQALREGLPWRASLPLPPAPGAFTPSLAADPRDPTPLESRAMLPPDWTATLDHPPALLLRTPAVPSETGALTLLERLEPLPALRWLPPEWPPPGPFEPDHPWAPAAAFPYPSDPGNGQQRSLFEELD